MIEDRLFQPTRLLSYVVAYDTGLAPNISAGLCTLAVCKPVIRQKSVIGQDWIIGISTAAHGRNRVIYAMPVDEKITYADYFNDPRFVSKKPDQDPRGDNFFKWTGAEYEVASHAAAHYGSPGKIARDIKAPTVIVGRHFWYFGEKAPELPPALQETMIVLPDRSRRGHRVIDDRALIQSFIDWIQHYPPGIYGRPRDADPSSSCKSCKLDPA